MWYRQHPAGGAVVVGCLAVPLMLGITYVFTWSETFSARAITALGFGVFMGVFQYLQVQRQYGKKKKSKDRFWEV
jgi:uncharacterized membrane protein